VAPEHDAGSEAPDGEPADAPLLSAADLLAADAEPGDDDSDIEVLECNWPAVQVYLACQWTVGVGMEAIVWFGISAAEILAAMRILQIARADHAATLRRVRIMVGAARPLLNRAR
jgi:hypothetical protein